MLVAASDCLWLLQPLLLVSECVKTLGWQGGAALKQGHILTMVHVT